MNGNYGLSSTIGTYIERGWYGTRGRRLDVIELPVYDAGMWIWIPTLSCGLWGYGGEKGNSDGQKQVNIYIDM